MAHFLGPQKKAKEELLSKVRHERAERKLIKKKEESSYVIQDWWRGTHCRYLFLKKLRMSSDRDNKLIATHCKQNKESLEADASSKVMSICLHMIRKLNIFYDYEVEHDRNRLTIMMANTLRLAAQDVDHNCIAHGFNYREVDKKQSFYGSMHKLWLNIGDTIKFYHSQYYAKSSSKAVKRSITTHIKILINFRIFFLDVSKWKVVTKSMKKNHPSFIKKYICNKPTQFYREWKQMIVFCDDLGLKSIASSALYASVIPTKLSPHLLKELSQEILSIPHLSHTYRDLFVVEKNGSIELSDIWSKCLALFSSNKKAIKISGKSRCGIPNSAWFISNCCVLICAVDTMNAQEFSAFQSFFSGLISRYSSDLMVVDECEVDEAALNEYHSGFAHLYSSDVISSLFWGMFDDDKLLQMSATYRTIVTEALRPQISRAIRVCDTRRFELIHDLIIRLQFVMDIKTKYLSTLSFATPCLSVLWRVLVDELGPIESNVERWKDAIYFNDYIQRLLDLLLMAYNHLVFVIEREEFIAQKQPFECADLVPLIALLRDVFFEHCTKKVLSSQPNLVNSIRRFVHQMLDRNTQHTFCSESTFHLEEKSIELWRSDVASDLDTFAFNILDRMPYSIPFVDRVAFMRGVIADEKAQLNKGGAIARVLIRRGHVVEDGFVAINKLGLDFRKQIKVNFVDEFGATEAGIDMGGVFKEFLELSTRQIFSDNYGLFVRTEADGLYYPNPTAKDLLGEECGHLMEFIGRILAKAVLEGICVDIPFAPFFIGKLFGAVSRVEDLFILDPVLYKNLMFLKHYDGDVESDLALTFSTSKEVLDKRIIIDLAADGRNVAVTNDNRIQYIYKLTRYLLDQQFEYQTSYFVQGFYAICNQKLCKIFSIKEFIRIAAGTDDEIDVADWRKHTKYDAPYHNKHRIIGNFWSVVKSMTTDEKKQLLQFTTSNRRPPLMGFKNLQPQFKIQPVSTFVQSGSGSNPISSTFQSIFSKKPTKDPLPSAATCFNTLKLPMYTTKKILKQKLLKCIREAKGFHLT